MTVEAVDDQDERDLAHKLQNRTALGRLSFEEVVTAIKMITELGYGLSKPADGA